MKKVLSVLLAAAMVMGMSVSAFAAYSWGTGSTGATATADLGTAATNVDFDGALYVNTLATAILPDSTVEVNPGDSIYFQLVNPATPATAYKGVIDKNWSINIRGNQYVDNASFVALTATGFSTKAADLVDTTLDKYVRVSVVKDLDEITSKDVKFNVQLVNNKSDAKSSQIKVVASFANLGENTVSFDWANDVDEAAVWKVAKNTKGTAVFDFEDNAYFTVKMISEEKVTLNVSYAYDKAIDKEYNEYDADLDFYNFKGSKDSFTKVGELFIPAAKDTYIYEIVDGKVVEVEAEYNKAYKVDGFSAKAGWVIETKDLGYYVVADDELVVEEEVAETPATETETNKTNPETGAADFVGAAVAMAVVSVAAAGALALKK